MNPSLAIVCPEPRCKAEVGEACLTLNQPSFQGQRNGRQCHGVRVAAAKAARQFPKTPKAVSKHAGFLDITWRDAADRTLYEALTAAHGHTEARRLWHAAHDLEAARQQGVRPAHLIVDEAEGLRFP